MRSIEELSIRELLQLIKEKKRLAKKGPALRRRKKALLAELAEIDRQLAMIGQGPGRSRGPKPQPAEAAAPAPKKAAAAKEGGKRKRRPRGMVQNAILKALGDKTLSPSQVSEALAAGLLKGVTSKNVMVTMDKMYRAGKLDRVGRGQYKVK